MGATRETRSSVLNAIAGRGGIESLSRAYVDQKDVGLNDVKLALEVLVLRVDRLLRLGTAAV